MPTYEVWSIDRYDSARVVAETREEAVEWYAERADRLGPLISVQADRVIKEYDVENGEFRSAFADWRN